MNLAKHLAAYRAEKGVTLAWVGERIGTTRSGVHAIENRASCSLTVFVRLVKLLKLTPDEIASVIRNHPAVILTPKATKKTRG